MSGAFPLRPVGGLGNRLQAIFGYRAEFGALDVTWESNADVCGAHFLDVFEPLPDVRFISPHEASEQGHAAMVDYAPPFPPPPDWEEGYGDLLLRPKLAAALVGDLKAVCASYDAMHVRRRDQAILARRVGLYVDDVDFHIWLRSIDRLHNIWLATDNGASQAKWLEEGLALGKAMLYKTSLPPCVSEETDEHDHSRVTSLENAVIDLWMCAHAREFFGSGAHSTFTLTIERLRKVWGK